MKDVCGYLTDQGEFNLDIVIQDVCGVLFNFIKTNPHAWAPIISNVKYTTLYYICKYLMRIIWKHLKFTTCLSLFAIVRVGGEFEIYIFKKCILNNYSNYKKYFSAVQINDFDD